MSTTRFLLPVLALAALMMVEAGAQNAYQSVWAQLHPDTLAKAEDATLSPMFRDFYQAAAAQKLPAATRRWQKFHDQYSPGDGGFEDAVHERFWNWARLELERSRLLSSGDAAAAAKVEQALKARAEAEKEG